MLTEIFVPLVLSGPAAECLFLADFQGHTPLGALVVPLYCFALVNSPMATLDFTKNYKWKRTVSITFISDVNFPGPSSYLHAFTLCRPLPRLTHRVLKQVHVEVNPAGFRDNPGLFNM